MTTHHQNSQLNLVAEAVLFEAADTADAVTPLRRFTMTAYTGGPMQLGGWRYPVVVDLQGMQMGKQVRPILLDHTYDVENILGQTDSVAVLNNQLIVTGQVMGDSPKARQVIALNDRGFAWQASIGARADQVEFVAEGKSSMVNGQEVTGPLNIARRSTLGEVSFVVLGADDNTSAQIAASQSPSEDEVTTFEGWLVEHGFDEAELQAGQRTMLEQIFRGAEPSPITASVTSTASNTVTEPDVQVALPVTTEDPVQTLRNSMATELNRIAAIRRACCGRHPDIESKAITEGWDPMRAELEVLRLDRPKAPAIHSMDRSISTNVLEAACMISARHPDVESQYDDKTIETATRRFRGGIGLQELLLEAAWANGYTGRTFRDNREVLRFAFNAPIQAGISTVEVAGILSNVANKFLLEGFFSVERVWRNICAVRNVNDFKTISSYRLIGKDQYELVAPGGEIQHGTLGEEKYQNKADTYGLLLSIDRRDIINDDLGAITTVPRKLGRGSGLKINDVFWTTFLNNSAFFTTGNKNFLSGANSVLGIDSMTLAETAFMDQVDGDSKPIGVMPTIALVPTALSAPATQLYKSLEMRDNTANARMPISNPHQGKYRVEVSRYLGNAAYSGSSTKAWYLVADPADLPLIEVALLNGQESPTIETAEADFNVLGIQMRGFHDFGVSLQDFRAAVKVKGEA